jgi:hypothetical protein
MQNASMKKKILSWLNQLQNEQIASRNHQLTPLQDILAKSEIQGDVFDSILTFENYPVSKFLASHAWSLKVDNIKSYGQSNYPLTIIVKNTDNIAFEFISNTEIIEVERIQHLRNHFNNILEQIISYSATKVKELLLFTEEEQNQFLLKYGKSKVFVPNGKTIVTLFEEIAETATKRCGLSI